MAGACAATASVFAKLAMTPAVWRGLFCETLLMKWTIHSRTCYAVSSIHNMNKFSFSHSQLATGLVYVTPTRVRDFVLILHVVPFPF